MGNVEFTKAGITELIKLLRTLKNIGVESLTLTSPQMIELVQIADFGFKVKASAICEITTPGKSLFYKDSNIERIVVDPDITRDFNNLKGICKVFGDGVEIIVNNVCYKNCAYKMFHYNHEAHCISQNAEHIKDYFSNRCSIQKARNFKNIIRLNWIRPEDLQYYIAVGIHHFKIQGRQNILRGDIVKTLKYYFSEEYDGNLYDLITLFAPYNSFQPYINNKKLDGFVKRFYDYPNFCNDLCGACGYCESIAKMCMDLEQVEDLNAKALEFYGSMDNFTKEVRTHETL